MTIKTNIEDPSTGTLSRVTKRGQIVTSPLEYSLPYNATAGTANVAVNVITPRVNKCFVITDILLYANKNVGVNDAAVNVYEATSDSSTVVTKKILELEIPKFGNRTLIGLNMIVTGGRWVNVKTDDDDVFVTIMGYYVDA